MLVDFDTIAAPEGLGSGLTIVGTPGYTAPEQFAGDASPASDLYSLGATLLFVVTHVDADKLPRDHGRFALGDRLMGLPDRVRTVLARMIEPDRAARYPGATAALADLRVPVPAPAPAWTPAPVQPWRPSREEVVEMADAFERPTVERPVQPAPAAPAWAPGITPPTPVDDFAEYVARQNKRSERVNKVVGGMGIALGVIAIPATIVIIIASQSHSPPPPPPRPAAPAAPAPAPKPTGYEGCMAGDVKECEDIARYRSDKEVFFKKGCELGSAYCCNGLGRYHERGLGVKKDPERAIELYGRACKADYAVACFNLAVMLRTGPSFVQDLKGALAADQRACDLGNEKGCYNLGVVLHEGRGTRVDFEASAAAYRRSCDKKYPRACYNLGLMSDAGEGGVRDPAVAAAYFTQACDLGDKDACVKLAAALAKGRGVPKDEERAATLVRGQCRGGHQPSCDLFKKLKRQ